MVAGHPDQHYGTQRMYASAGWGISAMIVGHLMDSASSQSLLSDYTLGFEVMLVAWLADAVAISFMKVFQSILFFGEKQTSYFILFSWLGTHQCGREIHHIQPTF